MSHPDYKKDSVVSQTINYDLLVAVDEMYVLSFVSVFLPFLCQNSHSERGVRRAPELLPADYRGGDKDQGTL
jgi:glutamate--cysteine ligase catalytic subunit